MKDGAEGCSRNTSRALEVFDMHAASVVVQAGGRT